MSVKMRLARHGRKRYAYYHIVIADSRAPRDGRYIESIGTYNPNSNPATINLDFDKAYDWLTKGAQPTDTVRAILSYKGVLYKKHLMGGVKKGAFDTVEAEKRLDAWMTEKDAKIQAKIDRLAVDADKEVNQQFAAEVKKKEQKAAAIVAKNAELAAEARAARDAAARAETPAEDTEAPETEVTEAQAEVTETPETEVTEAQAEVTETQETEGAEAQTEAPAEDTEAPETKGAEAQADDTAEDTEAPETKGAES